MMYKLSIAIMPGLILCGCATTSIEHLSADEFIKMATPLEQHFSADWKQYIGMSGRRVYLEHGTIITSSNVLTSSYEPKITVYWTEAEKLPVSFVSQLKTFKSQWPPHLEQAK